MLIFKIFSIIVSLMGLVAVVHYLWRSHQNRELALKSLNEHLGSLAAREVAPHIIRDDALMQRRCRETTPGLRRVWDLKD